MMDYGDTSEVVIFSEVFPKHFSVESFDLKEIYNSKISKGKDKVR